jgi:hypothetical protein
MSWMVGWLRVSAQFSSSTTDPGVTQDLERLIRPHQDSSAGRLAAASDHRLRVAMPRAHG